MCVSVCECECVCVGVCGCVCVGGYVGRCTGMGRCVLDEGGEGQTNILLTLCGSSLHAAGTWMMSSLWR